MHKSDDIIRLLKDNLPDTAEINEAAIIKDYEKVAGNATGIAVKILSVLGGIMASAAFLGFLFIAGLNSEVAMLGLGLLSIFSGLMANKVLNNLVLDTAGVTFFVTGFILVGLGMYELKGSDTTICLVMITLAVTAIIINHGYVIAFISSLIINISLIALINISDTPLLFHVYNAALVILFVLITVKEAAIFTSGSFFADLIGPFRLSVILSMLAGFMMVSLQTFMHGFNVYLPQISSAVAIAAIVYLSVQLSGHFNIRSVAGKLFLYSAVVLCLLPTIMFPAIAASLLLITGNFYLNYKPGYVIGALALVYSICQYYYDLQITLLEKSIILMVSGVLMLTLIFVSKSVLKPDAKG